MGLTDISRCFVPALCAGVFLFLASSVSFAADERCGQLVTLSKQYRGVALSEEQKSIKVQLVTWYKQNCGRGRRLANG